jgi:hypothetical protein
MLRALALLSVLFCKKKAIFFVTFCDTCSIACYNEEVWPNDKSTGEFKKNVTEAVSA